MNKNSNFGVWFAVIVVAITTASGFVWQSTKIEQATRQDTIDTTVGAVVGPDYNKHAFFNSGITVGQRVATTSTGANVTTVFKDFQQTPSYIDWLPNVNVTVSLTSTSTQALVPKVGDVARVMVRNASTTAASSITFAAANANVDLQFAEATGGDLVLNGLDWAELIFIRESDYLVTVIFNEFTEAD